MIGTVNVDNSNTTSLKWNFHVKNLFEYNVDMVSIFR